MFFIDYQILVGRYARCEHLSFPKILDKHSTVFVSTCDMNIKQLNRLKNVISISILIFINTHQN